MRPGNRQRKSDDRREIFFDADRGETGYYDEDDLWTPTSATVVGGRKNLVRNSGFWFARRQTPGSTVTYSSTAGRAISADGWGISNENASVTYARTSVIAAPEVGLLSPCYGTFTKITNNGKLMITQVIEGIDTTVVRGKTVRLSVLLKQSGALPGIRLGLLQLEDTGTTDSLPATFISAWGASSTDPTLGTNVARIHPGSAKNGTITGDAIDCTIGDDWALFGGTWRVPRDCKNLIVALWSNASVAATRALCVSQVSLTLGPELAPWAPLPYSAELARVQRYYAKTFETDTGPAQNVGTNTGALRCIIGKAGATASAAQFHWRFAVPLRAAASTITTYNPAATNAEARRIAGAGADLTGTTAAGSATSIDIVATGDAGAAVGDGVLVHATADAEL